MGFRILRGVIAHGPVTRSAVTITVLHSYALRADDETGLAYLPRTLLARQAKTNPRTIRRSVKELVDKGYLLDTGEVAYGPRGRTPKIYQVMYSCNSQCFRINENEHYPEGDPETEYDQL